MSSSVISTAPAHIRTRYMRGRCWAMAAELSRVTGLDLWGIQDASGDLHHVFVADLDQDLAIDIRGGMPMDKVAEGCMADILGPATQEEMFRHIGSLDPDDVRQARRDVKEHFSGLPKRPSRKKVAPRPEDDGFEPNW